MPDAFDLEPHLDWRDGLPLPRWDWIESKFAPQDDPTLLHEFWTSVARQWTASLRDSLRGYTVVETPRFLLLESTGPLGGSAERFRSLIASRLEGVAEFGGVGKHVVFSFRDNADYYRYVSLHTPEGEQGSSGGMQIREGYGHIAINGSSRGSEENTLAHELTHVALMHLDLPPWVEEGLAQMMEHDLTGRQFLHVNQERADQHKRHWSRNGLGEFWFGDGFHRSGEVQKLSYELAEILMRLLIEEHRPRWFGFSRDAHRKLIGFLRSATRTDGGEAAAANHLGRKLSDIAAIFLGRAAHGEFPEPDQYS